MRIETKALIMSAGKHTIYVLFVYQGVVWIVEKAKKTDIKPNEIEEVCNLSEVV